VANDWSAAAQNHIERLEENSYPGRGIIIGLTPDGTRLLQVYWIMGRSENSRNRVFIGEDNGFLRTEAKDPAKLSDPSLIIYYPLKHTGSAHIVTNGDQTDTIYDALLSEGTFEQALSRRTYEPDAPNYTPRISGIADIKDEQFTYKLSILKTNANDPVQTLRHFYTYEKAIAGYGHLIHTYSADGDPLPSFQGEPVLVPLQDSIDATANFYWGKLNELNRVSLLVKSIRLSDGQTELKIINKY
jgi:IMP cyclohydrolase